MEKGTLALDIDGTITDSRSMLSDEVVNYLNGLYEEGWAFIFVTGREFGYTMESLAKLPFNYYIGVQNGADLIAMPEKRHIKEFYLSKDCVLDLQKIYDQKTEDFLVYAGFEKGDYCYFRPDKYSSGRLKDVLRFKRKGSLDWVELNDFNQIPQSSLSMIKCIGNKEEFADIERKLLVNHSLNIVTIKNPKTWNSELFLITAFNAAKCHAVKYLMKEFNLKRPLIAAGDDNNDESNLKLADVSVVMETAPNHLLRIGDVIAPPSVDNGIIKGLEEAKKIAYLK